MLLNSHFRVLFLSTVTILVVQSKQAQFETNYRLEQVERVLEEIKTQVDKISINLEKKKLHYCNDERRKFPKNCQEALHNGSGKSGVYAIWPDDFKEKLNVFCNMETKGGGWIYVLNRFDGSEDFYLNWENYRDGFGNLSAEFWLGLEHLHKLTNADENEMLVELVGWTDANKTFYVKYDYIKVGGETEGYPIKILGRCEGDAGDALIDQVWVKFSTKDRDNDRDRLTNCAQSMRNVCLLLSKPSWFPEAAWWYSDCFHGQLTGVYFNESSARRTPYEGITWFSCRGFRKSFKEARIMIRPRSNVKSP